MLPCRLYLRHCVLAARGLGSSVALDSFLDSTFLASVMGGMSVLVLHYSVTAVVLYLLHACAFGLLARAG